MKYPKINSLWKREGFYFEATSKDTADIKKSKQSFIEGDYACEEFGNVNNWLVTEKIDGMNIRIHAVKDCFEWNVKFYGRTDDAMLPPQLAEYLQGHFTANLFDSVFFYAKEVVLYGEGYGAKIQTGGYYSKEQRFVLFDVLIDNRWWMEYDKVVDIAKNLEIYYAPILATPEGQLYWQKDDVIAFIKKKPNSVFAKEVHEIEGVVARAYPMMLTRDGIPIKFKLKCKDFQKVE